MSGCVGGERNGAGFLRGERERVLSSASDDDTAASFGEALRGGLSVAVRASCYQYDVVHFYDHTFRTNLQF